jgi:16S rRNA (uracil1498-N3)-methyltransferase
MPSKLHRLFVKPSLCAGGEVVVAGPQSHYLLHVLRLKPGDEVLLFNGMDGEWRCALVQARKDSATLRVAECSRPQQDGPDLHYLFAPLKRARLDYMAQKATELGASRLQPVLTRRTVVEQLNRERLLANAVEAAEQCNLLRVPEIGEPRKLEDLLTGWDPRRRLIFADEQGSHGGPLAVLSGLEPQPLAVLIGPEGGFEPAERARLLEKRYVVPMSLGPRIMRADTAAVAALALVNAVLGDWRS